MKFLKSTLLVFSLIFFHQTQTSAQYSGPDIDVNNITPSSEMAINLEKKKNDLVWFINKDHISSNSKSRKNKGNVTPETRKTNKAKKNTELKTEKVDGYNISISSITEKGHFDVKIDDDYSGAVHFQLLDSKAQLMERKTKFIHNGKNRFNFKNDYPPGTYLITINYNGETFLKQLIIE